MTGHGGTFATALSLGARGEILAVALFASELALEVWAAHHEQRQSDVDAAQKPLVPMGSEIVARMGVPGVKAAMERVGLRGGSVRLPLLPTASADLRLIDELLRDSAMVARGG
jgi:4-hydroxy-2-oxoglutarate aldolase